MPYFKDMNGGQHFIESRDFVSLLPVGCVEISEAEAEEMRRPIPLSGNALVLSQIVEQEAKITYRRLREAVLGIDNGWLKSMNDQIAALRKQLK